MRNTCLQHLLTLDNQRFLKTLLWSVNQIQ